MVMPCHRRVSRDLVVGPSLTISECDLSMWLSSPMFLGGVNDCDVESKNEDESLWKKIVETTTFKTPIVLKYSITSDIKNFDVPELDNNCRYVPSLESFDDVPQKCTAYASSTRNVISDSS